MIKMILKNTFLASLLLQPLHAESFLDMGKSLGGSLEKSFGGLFSNGDSNVSKKEKEIPKKKVAIRLDPETSPEGLFDNKIIPVFQNLQKNGDIKSFSKEHGVLYKTFMYFNVQTDDLVIAKKEASDIQSKIKNALKPNLLLSGNTKMLPQNILLGDKSLFYMPNPYKGCLEKHPLASWIGKDFQVVEESEKPDYVISIKLEACLTEGEFEPQYAQYKGKPLDMNSTKPRATDLGLIQSGVNTSAMSNTVKGDQVGMAMAGVGVAFSAIDWLLRPTERDMVRLKATFESTGKKSFTFYPTSYSSSTHDKGDTPSLNCGTNAMGTLYRTFIDWEKNAEANLSKIPQLHTSKDIFSAVASARDKVEKNKQIK